VVLLPRQQVDLLRRQPQDHPDVAHGRTRAEGDRGADERGVPGVAPQGVLDDLFAPRTPVGAVRRQVEVDVGRVGAAGVEEAREAEVVRERLDGGDAQTVTDERPDGAPPPLTQDAASPRVAHEVPHDEKVVGQAQARDDTQLVRQPRSHGRAPGVGAVAGARARGHQLLQVRGGGVAVRDGEGRRRRVDVSEREPAAVGQFDRPAQRRRQVGEAPRHLGGTAQAPRRAGTQDRPRPRQGHAFADAHEHVL